MKLFDTHTHLCDSRFDQDRECILNTLLDSGVCYILECATAPDDIKTVLALGAHPQVLCAIGVTPHSADEYTEQTTNLIRAHKDEICAIGEIGLDYHYDLSPRNVQLDVFETQLKLAKELDKPVVLHSREATEDMQRTLKRFAPLPGVMHCFSGSVETAREALDMGLHIAFGGTLTFKNAKKTVAVAEYVPLNRILIETDCPYLAPTPHRGKRNQPEYVRLVAERIAEIRGLQVEDVISATTENAKALFLS